MESDSPSTISPTRLSLARCTYRKSSALARFLPLGSSPSDAGLADWLWFVTSFAKWYLAWIARCSSCSVVSKGVSVDVGKKVRTGEKFASPHFISVAFLNGGFVCARVGFGRRSSGAGAGADAGSALVLAGTKLGGGA